jgi:hemoglobin/transferrin/lactoferrin receptor protein
LAAYDLNVQNNHFFGNTHIGINHQLIEESRHQRKFNSEGLQNRIEQVGVSGANIDLQHKDDQHELQLGLDAQYNTLISTANVKNILSGEVTPLDTRYPGGDNTMLNAAVYASHIWKINRDWNLTDGIRIGYISLNSNLSDTTFFKFPFTSIQQKSPVYSGSLGLVHHPSPDLKMSFLLSSGYRVPNIDDLSKIFESAGGQIIVPNPNIKPEKTVNAEWGFSKIMNHNTRLETSVYYTSFFDAIQTSSFTYNNQDSIMYDGVLSAVAANQNLGQAYLYGFSGNLKSQMSETLSFLLTMNYTYGRVKTDSSDVPLDHISPFMAKMQIAYSNKKVSTDFYVLYNGWKRLKDYSPSGEDNLVYATPAGMPAWLTANWRASFTASQHFTIQAGIENIFDTQYRVFASGMNAPGRNLYLSLRYSM